MLPPNFLILPSSRRFPWRILVAGGGAFRRPFHPYTKCQWYTPQSKPGFSIPTPLAHWRHQKNGDHLPKCQTPSKRQTDKNTCFFCLLCPSFCPFFVSAGVRHWADIRNSAAALNVNVVYTPVHHCIFIVLIRTVAVSRWIKVYGLQHSRWSSAVHHLTVTYS